MRPKFQQKTWYSTLEVDRILDEIAQIKVEFNQSAIIREALREYRKQLQKEAS